MTKKPGMLFREALQQEVPLQVIGTINANHALLAQQAGFKAIYLSGGGVAAGSLGLPDLGITNLNDVLIDVERITNVCSVPLLVDIDTGFGPSAFNVGRTIKSLNKAGAAAVHLEDQVGAKRCGHRPGKELVSPGEMSDRIKAACDSRLEHSFMIGARTDAIASEGLESALERAFEYKQAGADFIFAEAVENIEHYRRFKEVTELPILANITEFGKTPLYTRAELANVGVSIILYPLSGFRAANRAAANVFKHIREDGTQSAVIDTMQTRNELYDSINYYAYEARLDQLFNTSEDDGNK